MRHVKLNRLYGGDVSLRDYTVDGAIEKGESVEVSCHGQTMYLTLDDLKRGVRGTEEYQSKFNGKTYRLVDFKWKPNQKSML